MANTSRYFRLAPILLLITLVSCNKGNQKKKHLIPELVRYSFTFDSSMGIRPTVQILKLETKKDMLSHSYLYINETKKGEPEEAIVDAGPGKVWMLPPRSGDFSTLVMGPYPEVIFPAIKTKSWKSSVYIPQDQFQNTGLNGQTIFHRYTITNQDTTYVLGSDTLINVVKIIAEVKHKDKKRSGWFYYHNVKGFVAWCVNTPEGTITAKMLQ